MKINTTNYEEYFLLYIDNELSAEEKTAVENFMEENPLYKNEFKLLQQTVLSPENIEFEDKVLLYRLEDMEAKLPTTFKQSLYRNEAKVIEGFFNVKLTRSIAAVAAIFLLVLGYKLTTTIPGKQNNQTEIANNTRLPIIKRESKLAISTNAENKKFSKPEINKILPSASISIQIIGTTNEKNGTQQASIIQPIATLSNHLTAKENEIHAAPIVNNSVAIAAVNEKIVNNEESIVAEAKEDFENIITDNPDRTIYIANMEIDGDKLRGFTRRIGAFIKRNKTEKEK
jgi:hypothetical protein